MTDQRIAEILSVTKEFASPRRIWPYLITMWGLTFCENFSKPFLRRLPGKPYPFLPEAFFGIPLDIEFRGWVEDVFPADLMQVFDHAQPERNLPSWLPTSVFEQINHNVGVGFSRLARRRHILAAAYGPGLLVSLGLILAMDLVCMVRIKDAFLAGDLDTVILDAIGYVWAMLIMAICLGYRRRAAP